MRLEKLPFVVVLLVGRVNFHGLYMVRVPGGVWDYSWKNLNFKNKVVASVRPGE